MVNITGQKEIIKMYHKLTVLTSELTLSAILKRRSMECKRANYYEYIAIQVQPQVSFAHITYCTILAVSSHEDR